MFASFFLPINIVALIYLSYLQFPELLDIYCFLAIRYFFHQDFLFYRLFYHFTNTNDKKIKKHLKRIYTGKILITPFEFNASTFLKGALFL